MADNNTKIVITAEDRASGVLDKVGGSLGALGRFATTLNPLVAGVAGAGFVISSLAKGAIESADALNDMSQRLGIGVRELAAYKLAAEQSGTSLEAIGRGVKGLATNMVEHGAALKAAGITAKDSNGAMRQLADVFASMPDGVEKAALATKLFGKAGMDLIPMLNMGSKGLDESAAKAKKYADTMAVLAPQADQINDSMAELALSGQVLGASLAVAAAPALNDIARAMALAAQEGGLLQAAFVGVGGVMDEVSKPLRGVWKGVRAEIMETEATWRESLASITTGKFSEQQAKLAAASRAGAADLWKDLREMDSRPSSPAPSAAKPPELKLEEWRKKYAALWSGLKEGEKSGGGEAAQVAKEMLDNRLKMVAAGLDHERALLEQSHAAGITTEVEYQEALYRAAIGGLGKRAAALQTQLDKTTDASDRQKIIGELQAVQAEAIKAGDAYALSRIKMTNASDEFLKSQAKDTASLAERVQKAREELAVIGLSAEQKDELAAAANTAAAAQLDEAAAAYEAGRAYAELTGNQDGVAFHERARDAANAQADALREIASLERQQGAKRAAVKAAEDSAKAWEKFADDIERALTDSLMRGFESGKGFGESFVDSLRNTLKTAVLKIAVQAVVDPIMGGVRGAFGVPSQASGGGIGGGLLNVASGINSVTGATAAVASMESWAMTAAGQMGPPSALAATGATAMSSVAAAAPYVAAALVAAEAFGLFGDDDERQRQLAGTGMEGTISRAGLSGSMVSLWGTPPNDYWGGGTRDPIPADTQSAINAQVAAAFAAAEKSAAALGVSAAGIGDITHTFSTAGAGADAELDAAISATMDKLARAVIPSVDDYRIAGESLSATTQRLTGDVVGMRAVFDAMGNDFTAAGDDAVKLSQQIVAAFGGSSAMASAWQGYYDGYFTAEEKAARLAQSVGQQFDALNIAMPTTRAEFRALVEGLDLTSDAGRSTFAALVGVSGAFGQVADAAKAAADAAAKSALDGAMAAVDGALTALSRAVDADRNAIAAAYEANSSALNGTLDGIIDRVGKLGRFAGTLRGAVDNLRPLSFAEARAQIDAALAVSRAGGPLPADGQLDRALQAIAKNDAAQYASAQDFARDQARAAASMSDLADIADEQLSAAELSRRAAEDQLAILERTYAGEMARLDGILADGQAQIDVLRGIDNSVISLAAALSGFKAATTTATATVATTGSSDPIGALYESVLGRAPEASGRSYWSAQFGESVDAAELQTFLSEAQKELNARLPQFAVGTNYVPRDMVAQIHAGEEITPRPYVDLQRVARDETNALLTRLVAANQALEKRLAAIEGHTSRTAKATNGAPDAPVLVEIAE